MAAIRNPADQQHGASGAAGRERHQTSQRSGPTHSFPRCAAKLPRRFALPAQGSPAEVPRVETAPKAAAACSVAAQDAPIAAPTRKIGADRRAASSVGMPKAPAAVGSAGVPAQSEPHGGFPSEWPVFNVHTEISCAYRWKQNPENPVNTGFTQSGGGPLCCWHAPVMQVGMS